MSFFHRRLPPPVALLVLAVFLALAPPTTADPKTRLAPGKFLVAKPGMLDPNFAQTVVLLLAHDESEGTVGVILNRRTRVRLTDVMPPLEALGERDDAVFWGGPVGPENLVFLLRVDEPPEGCQPVLEDVCTGSIVDLIHLSDQDASRACAGYAGWAPGQLEWELQEDGWYVLPASSERIFGTDPEVLWEELRELAEAPVA